MIKNETVEITISRANKKYYNQLGYICNVNDIVNINIGDLPLSSKVRILIECDYCGKIIERFYYNHVNQTKKDIIHKDACEDCRSIKTKESNLLIHGVENVGQLEDVRVKMKKTLIEKYGVEHQMQLDETKNKIRQTNLFRYGTEIASQNDNVKEKTKNTNLERYGETSYTKTNEYKEKTINTNLERYNVKYAMQNDEIKKLNKQANLDKYGVENVFMLDEIKDKIKITNIKKYGFASPMQNEEIKNKCLSNRAKSLYLNGDTTTSKQQIYLYNLLGGILNYSVEQFNLDIAFPEDKLYIEYNGGGHDLAVKTGRITESQLKQIDMKRYFILKKLGWKQICIISPRDYLPEDNIILQEINNAKEWLSLNILGHSHYNIIFSEFVNDLNFGKLRHIN